MAPYTEGNQTNEHAYYAQQQQYEAPYQPPTPAGSPIDDNLVEAIAQRMTQRINQGTSGKIGVATSNNSRKLSSGQRTALGIVSICVLVPLGIVLSERGPVGLICLGIVCAAIFLINAVANG
jgi:hypothetical protein